MSDKPATPVSPRGRGPVGAVVAAAAAAATPAHEDETPGAILADDGTEDVLAAIFDPIFRSGAQGQGLIHKIVVGFSQMPSSMRGLAAAPLAALVEKFILGRYLKGDSTGRYMVRLLIRNGILAAARKFADVADDAERLNLAAGAVQHVENAVRTALPQVIVCKGDRLAHKPYVRDGKIVMKTGGGGKDGGGRIPQVACKDVAKAMDEHDAREVKRAGQSDKHRPQPFGLEAMDLDLAEEQGRDECPTCKPYTVIREAEEAAHEEEADMADTEHDAAGHPAPAKKPAAKADTRKRLDTSTLTAVERRFIVVLKLSLPDEHIAIMDEVMHPDDPVLLKEFIGITVRKMIGKAPSDTLEDADAQFIPDVFEDADIVQALKFFRSNAKEGAVMHLFNQALEFFEGKKAATQKKAEETAKAETLKQAEARAKTAQAEADAAKAAVKRVEDAQSSLLKARYDLGQAKASGDPAKEAAAQAVYDAAQAAYAVLEPEKARLLAEREKTREESAKADAKAAEAKAKLAEAEKPKHEEKHHHSPWPRRFAVGIVLTIILGAVALAIAHHSTTSALLAP